MIQKTFLWIESGHFKVANLVLLFQQQIRVVFVPIVGQKFPSAVMSFVWRILKYGLQNTIYLTLPEGSILFHKEALPTFI